MNKIHLSINYSQLMRRVFLAYRIALILLLLAALFLPEDRHFSMASPFP